MAIHAILRTRLYTVCTVLYSVNCTTLTWTDRNPNYFKLYSMYVCVTTPVVLRLVVFSKQSRVNCGCIKTEDTVIASLSLSVVVSLVKLNPSLIMINYCMCVASDGVQSLLSTYIGFIINCRYMYIISSHGEL